jgi:phosphopantetheine adenylyltransferase
MMNKVNKNLITGFLSDKLTKKEKVKFLNKVSTDKSFLKELIREIELDDLIEEEFGAGDEDDIESDK